MFARNGPPSLIPKERYTIANNYASSTARDSTKAIQPVNDFSASAPDLAVAGGFCREIYFLGNPSRPTSNPKSCNYSKVQGNPSFHSAAVTDVV